MERVLRGLLRIPAGAWPHGETCEIHEPGTARGVAHGRGSGHSCLVPLPLRGRPAGRAAGGGVRGCGVAFLCWLRDGGARGGRREGAVLLQRLQGPDAHIVGHAAPRDRGGFDGLE